MASGPIAATVPSVRPRLLLVAMLALPVAACGPAEPFGEGEEPVGTTGEALSPGDPVSAAVDQSCSTTSVKGLSTQLVEEIQCMRPNTMGRIDTIKNANLGAAVFPYMQAPAAAALATAIKARGTTMAINSALRTLPQQYLLFRWYMASKCGVGLAASPGTSNHESGLAVDVEDNAGWQNAMKGAGFRWLGSSDPVHFDYVGGGAVSLGGMSVEAFQRLWNRNHPKDQIAEDGAYGPDTSKRLAASPVGGFPIGAQCNNLPDAGAPPPKPDAGATPTTPPIAPAPDDTDGGARIAPDDGARPAGAGGCSTVPGPVTSPSALLGLAMFLVARARRREITASRRNAS